MCLGTLTELAQQYCAWADSSRHDVETAHGLLVSLLAKARGLGWGALETEGSLLGPPQELDWADWKRFADFPFQCYYPVYWAGLPHPLTDNIHENFAYIYAELRRGLEVAERGEIADTNEYWRDSYLFRWGHHASAAVWAIEWHQAGEQSGEQIAPPNSRPPSPLPTSSEIQTPDSLRAPSSGGCG